MTKPHNAISKSFKLIAGIVMIAFGLIACNQEFATTDKSSKITEAEIIGFQKGYGISLVSIGNTYRNGGDYESAAIKHIQDHYGYDDGKVLFKPTFVKDEPVRTTFEGALSYFIGDNDSFPTDEGFALSEWVQIKWKNAGIINNDNIAIAMGRSSYIDSQKRELIKDYTMCLKKDANGKILLIAHKSSPVPTL